jgi:hypothetical protein
LILFSSLVYVYREDENEREASLLGQDLDKAMPSRVKRGPGSTCATSLSGGHDGPTAVSLGWCRL